MDHQSHSVEEDRSIKFSKHEPIWGAPGVTVWQILKYRVIRFFVIDLLTPAAPFAGLSTVWLFHWLYSGSTTGNTLVSLAILFVYLISWLFLIRRQDAGMLIAALASLIRGISIKWGGGTLYNPSAPSGPTTTVINTTTETDAIAKIKALAAGAGNATPGDPTRHS